MYYNISHTVCFMPSEDCFYRQHETDCMANIVVHPYSAINCYIKLLHSRALF